MKINHCKTNHMENPLGFQMDFPVVSWKVSDTKAKRQVAAQVIVALDEEFSHIIYDTGKEIQLSNLGVTLDFELTAFTRYYWKVSVWNELGGMATSDINWFETGRKDVGWQAEWITPSWEDKNKHPYFRKSFIVDKSICSARIYATGLGLYELFLNEEKVGNEYFSPGCTAADAWIQSYTYDVTKHLKRGENILGSLLGNGWAKGRFGVFTGTQLPYTDRFSLLLELKIEYTDGTSELIKTDGSWSCAESPIIKDSIYDGEIYDSNKEILYWKTAEAEGEIWDRVSIWKPSNLGEVTDRLSLPIRKMESIAPVQLIKTKRDEIVLDMGQNFAGWVSFLVDEPIGTTIKLSFGEVLQDGIFYNDNLRSAKQEYIYISNGQSRRVEPHFTFFGFRYVKLEGFTKEIELSDFMGHALYSQLEETGWIETGNLQVNRLFLNAKWSQKGNFLDVPTDCPQRDERLGWTGDAQVFSETASFNMESYAFYTKYLNDIWQEQKQRSGMVTNFVPSFLSEKRAVSDPIHGGAAVWGDAATIIPWRLYLHYGDKTILERQYNSMKAWVDWITDRIDVRQGGYLWRGEHQLGDWLALDGPVEGGTEGGTDKMFIASAFYHYSALIVSRAAAVLGIESDRVYFEDLSDRIKQSILDEFFSPTGRSTVQTQTAYVLTLYFKLLPKEFNKRTVDALVAMLEENNFHLETGFVGTPYLCRVLSEYQQSQAAYSIFLQEDFPSWLYQVKMGATTIWERWDSILPNGKISGTGMNSLNHYAYGAIVEWMYQHVAGVQSDEDLPGFKRFIVKPQIHEELHFTDCSYDSPMGLIQSSWRLAGNDLKLKILIPFNAEAKVYLPFVNTKTVSGIDSSAIHSDDNDEYYIELDSGEYHINYELTQDMHAYYSLDNTLAELIQIREIKRSLKAFLEKVELLPKELGIDMDKPLNEELEKLENLIGMDIRGITDLNDSERIIKKVRRRSIL